MNIIESTRAYETWLARVSRPLVPAHLRVKHERMRDGAFPFLRATFYRWAQNWFEVAEEFRGSPSVLAIGDLHIENFGTWRDLDGRLVWGVNDFDETFELPAAHDLVRLIVSAHLAVEDGAFEVDATDALEAVLEGYARGVREGGHPFVLEERNRWLRKIAMSELRDPSTFWEKLSARPAARGAYLPAAKRVLRTALPEQARTPRYVERVAGLGSLGRPRVVALSEWGGGLVCREAKAAAPSACAWAFGSKTRKPLAEDLLRKALRVRDPFYGLREGWIVRRLAPHCSKIDVAHLPRRRDELELLAAMGTETANVHLGSATAASLVRVVTGRARENLVRASDRMLNLTLADWKIWRRG